MKKFAGLKTVLENKFRLIKSNPKPYIIKGTVGALLLTTLLAGCSNKENNKQNSLKSVKMYIKARRNMTSCMQAG